MRITIVGGGKVGLSLAQNLVQEKHEIILIDTNEEVIEKTSNALDMIGYVGNGASFAVLKSVEIESCDLLIAVTGSDELNLLACLSAYKLGAKHTIARIRNPEYADHLFELKKDLGLSMFINPEKAAAEEIARILRFPSASRVELFARGRIELASFRLPANNILVNKPLSTLGAKLGIKVLICAVSRDGELFIPRGNFVLHAGDELYLTGDPQDMEAAFHRMNLYVNPVKNVMITGGGRISYYLAKTLRDRKMNIKIFERDKEAAALLAEALPEAVILNADADDHDILLEEGLDKADAFVALTGLDEGNILSALNALKTNVPKVIAKVNRDNMLSISETLGIESLISPKLSMINEILRYVRALDASRAQDHILSLYKLFGGRIEVIEFAAETEIPNLTDIPLSSLNLKPDLLVACLVRGKKTIVPRGQDKIMQGDGVLIVSARSGLNELSDIIADD